MYNITLHMSKRFMLKCLERLFYFWQMKVCFLTFSFKVLVTTISASKKEKNKKKPG